MPTPDEMIAAGWSENEVRRMFDEDAKVPLQLGRRVTVCDRCFTASCWQGEFYCQEAKQAGTVEKTVGELRLLGLEHEDYWRDTD